MSGIRYYFVKFLANRSQGKTSVKRLCGKELAEQLKLEIMMKKIMHGLFLSCLKATELIEKNFHVKLSFIERMQLKAHKMMCDACKNYEIQSILIEKGIETFQKNQKIEIDLEQLKKQISINMTDAKN